MTFGDDHAVLLDRLYGELRVAPALSPSLFAKVLASACTRASVLGKSGKGARIDRLLDANAWTDLALTLIELELPAWKLQRLARENGEWLCSLSRHPSVPAAIDDGVDAVHEVLPLAVLLAFVEARRRNAMACTAVPSVPQLRPMAEHMICCDNFA
jgi:hypothetical protein